MWENSMGISRSAEKAFDVGIAHFSDSADILLAPGFPVAPTLAHPPAFTVVHAGRSRDGSVAAAGGPGAAAAGEVASCHSNPL